MNVRAGWSIPRCSERRLLVLLLVWGSLAALQFFCLGSGSYIRIHDNADSNHPSAWSKVHHPSLSRGSEFDPSRLAGVDQLDTYGNVYSAIQVVLPGWAGFAFFMLLQRVMAAVSMYLMVRHVVRLGRAEAFLAGLLYPFLIALTELGIYHLLAEPGLPLYVFLLYRLARVGSLWVRLLVAAALGAFIAYSTSLFVSQPFLLAVIAYTLVAVDTGRWHRYVPIGLALGVGLILVDLPLVMSTSAVAEYGQRLVIRESITPIPISTIVWKIRGRGGLWMAANSTPLLLLAASGLLVRTRKDRCFRLFVLGFVYCGALIFVQEWFLINVVKVGFFRSFQSDRFYHYTYFFLVLSAVTTLGAWRTKGTQASSRITAGFSLLLILAFLPKAYSSTRTVQLNLAGTGADKSVALGIVAGLAGAFFLVIVFRRLRKGRMPPAAGELPFGRFLLAFTMLSLAGSFLEDITSSEKYDKLYERDAYAYVAARSNARAPFRVGTLFPTQRRHPAFAQLSGLETIDGYTSIYPMRFHRFWREVINGSIRQSENVRDYFCSWGQRVYLFGDRRYGMPARPDNVEQYVNLDLLSLANVRFLFSAGPVSGHGLKLVYSDIGTPDTLYVYENENVLNRAFLTPQAAFFPSAESLLDSLGRADTGVLSRTVFLEGIETARQATIVAHDCVWAGRAELVEYMADRVVVMTNSEHPGYLVLTNNWTRFWRATVGGEEVEILPAYHTFMAVRVPSGRQIVEFAYDRSTRRLMPDLRFLHLEP